MPVGSQVSTLSGPEFLVNTYTTSRQIDAEVTGLIDGGFIVSWTSEGQDGSDYGIYAQRYNAGGIAVGNEFRVNTYTVNAQEESSIAALADGGFVVSWTSYDQDGSFLDIYGQRYDASGGIQGGEFLINTHPTGWQTYSSVTGLISGGFVVTWVSLGQDGSGDGVYGQRFNASGVAQGGEFLINTFTSGDQFEPSIAALGDGGFIVTWTSWGPDSSGRGIFGQRFDANGVALGSEFQVNTFTVNPQHGPSVTGLVDGGFVVSWTSEGQDGSDQSIYGQRFNASGIAEGSEFRVNTYAAIAQNESSITALTDGGFVVSWTSVDQDGSGYGIFGQRFDASGIAQGDEFQVNTYTASGQFDSAITALAGGRFVVTWTSMDQDGSHYGIYAQMFNAYGDTPPPDRTAAEIFEAEGKLAFFSHMAHAAYHLASYEPTGARQNRTHSADQQDAYDGIAGTLMLLGSDDLPTLTEDLLDTNPTNAWHDLLGNSGDDLGVYTRTNAAALVGRSEDAVFIAFRGTNSKLGLDHVHWALRSAHFNKMLPLLRAVRDYIEERNAAGENIDKIFLTGHSLGAAMVQPAFEWLQKQLPGVTLEGVTFASPGYGLDLLKIDDDSSVNITNIWNAADIIQLAAEESEILGETFKYNNVLENLLDGIDPLTAHSMQLYSDIADMLRNESEPGTELDLAGLKGGLTSTGARIERISVSIQENSDGSFRIGDAPDLVIAGLFEYSMAAVKLLASPLMLSFKTVTAIVTAGKAAIDIVTAPISDPNVESVFDFAKSFFSEVGSTLGSIFEIIYDATGLKFLVDSAYDVATTLFRSDLLVGGAKDDLLFGLGGADVILGGAGDDHLYGGWGRDTLYGGNRNDLLHGGHGADRMLGGNGDDIYYVDNKRDTVLEFRNKGTDTVISSVSFTLPGTVERLILDGGLLDGSLIDGIEGHGNQLDNILAGDGWGNVLRGYGGVDLIFGGGNGDTIYGGTGNDVLMGGDGKDELFGGRDNDILDGGAKKDRYDGGAGSDMFVFASSGDIASDIIRDFQRGVDFIDLSGVSAEVAGGLAFAGTAFNGIAGEVIFEQVDRWVRSDFTWVKIDLTGDGDWDERIRVMGLHDMEEGDFIL